MDSKEKKNDVREEKLEDIIRSIKSIIDDHNNSAIKSLNDTEHLNIDESILAVKINCNNTNSPEIKNLIEKYEIKGLPSFIILNPFDDKVIDLFSPTEIFKNNILVMSFASMLYHIHCVITYF